jgi:hypothetical protein
MPLFEKTIRDKIIMMPIHEIIQQISHIKSLLPFSIACDVCDTADLLFSRYVNSHGSQKDLTTLLPLKAETHRENTEKGTLVFSNLEAISTVK